MADVTSEVYLFRSGEVEMTPGSQEGRKAWAAGLEERRRRRVVMFWSMAVMMAGYNI